MAGFIGVHIGAGNHSEGFNQEYFKICKEACKKGAAILAEGGSALDAATEAVTVLENSPVTNAGFGSSLTWDGTVECDASAMEGTTKLWGAVGAVSGVQNPCQLAKSICLQQEQEKSLGRIPPSLLVGQGATDWAYKNGLSVVDPNSLIHERAQLKYETYRKRVARFEKLHAQSLERLDTVGAVCIDGLGHTAAVCSSGGIPLKECGRLGQAAMFGAGCWAEDCNKSLRYPAVASCTTGCGEHLMRCSLAQKVATAVKEQQSQEPSCVSILHKTVSTQFLNSPMLTGVKERLGGALVLVCSPEDGFGELMWTHSTKTMGIGYMEVHSKPKSLISSLPNDQTPGNGLVVEGITFRIPALPIISNNE